jgi:hypothetical protein
MLRATLLAAALLLGPAAAPAATEERSPDAEVLTEGFLYAHPDLKHRLAGMQRYEEGKFEEAFDHFMEAARWADKLAQAMVAEMLWNGSGTGQDRAAAYAWMDLAAQRGYPSLVGLRERYWHALDQDQRRRALEVGQGIYAEFGDEVGQERLRRRLERERRKITGSRTGFTGALSVYVPFEGGWKRLDATEYYADKYWVPEKYFAWQDRIGQLPPSGVVKIGPLSPEVEATRGD